MEIEKLKRIIRLLKEEGLTEITLWEKGSRITVRRERTPVESSARTEDSTEPGDLPLEDEGTFTVTAPLLGTFYSRPAPEEDPFVIEGAEVKAGDTLCIIEAMKVMNEIKAEAPGRLKKILVEDGETVEYGRPLFLFEKE